MAANNLAGKESSLLNIEIEEEPFMVTPLAYCPHLEEINAVTSKDQVDARRGCEKCNDSHENWLCLHCYSTQCSRFVKGHMLSHAEESGHAMTLSFSDLSVWCYKCDSYVHNSKLQRVKELAYESKFGTKV